MNNVLVGEKDDRVRFSIIRCLDGSEISYAKTVEEFKKKMVEYNPNIIIVNQEMCEGDLLGYIKQEAKNDIALIIMTEENITSIEIANFIKNGAVYIIRNPFHEEELKQKINKINELLNTSNYLFGLGERGAKELQLLRNAHQKLRENLMEFKAQAV